ncbi:MAG: hypothetical protein QGH83_15935, partial [Candidatus Pacebacteria bacterium]|nr:hypothetical protein [Candidatus Paceibacterota bacterium]
KENMIRFQDLKFENTSYGGIKAEAKFGKYWLSVIKEPQKELFEIIIFSENGCRVILPGIHPHDDDEVDEDIFDLTPEEVTGIMLKLSFIDVGEPQPAI